jgi:hypothetical protein
MWLFQYCWRRNMAFIGNTNTTQAFTPAIDYFSGNGSTTAFTLSRPVASVAQVQAVVNNVAQNPSSAFTVSGNTITFTSAPSSGTNNIYVYYTSPITQVIAPGQGTVGTTSLSSSLLVPPAMVSDQNNTSTGYFDLPVGTTAQRPSSPVVGMIRYNTTTSFYEVYNGTEWRFISNSSYTFGVEYLVVAGGGAGANGAGLGAGGGGAGGMLTATDLNVTIGTTYTVTVGAGGAGSTASAAANGNNSVFNGITAIGGGGGNAPGNGAAGGSGGGAGYSGTGGAGTSGQGNNGGNGSGAPYYSAGGGGGKGAVGANGINSTAGSGAGGAGSASSITGSSVTYAMGAGGGGVSGSGAASGSSPAGAGTAVTTGTAGSGTANLGGGGGGSGNGTGGSGGSGVVVIKYTDTYPAASATTGSPTITVSGGFRVYKFNGTGSITF